MPTMALAMPPPASPTGRGLLREEIEIERLDALADDEEEHESERHQRQERRTRRARADEERRQHASRAEAGVASGPFMPTLSMEPAGPSTRSGRATAR